MLESAAQTADSRAQQRAEAALHAARQQQQQVQPQSDSATIKAAAATVDLEWLSNVPETAHGDLEGFSGQVLQEPYQGLQPSRAVLQQLHEAGGA